MKVLIINSVFKTGSTGRICYDIANEIINNGDDCVVAYGRGKIHDARIKTYKIGTRLGVLMHAVLSRITDKSGFYSSCATKKLIKFIQAYKPDVINLHNLHGYYINIEILFEYLKTSNIKVVWTMHDAWAVTGHCAYFDLVKCEKYKTGCYNCSNKKRYPKTIFKDNSKINYERKRKAFSSISNMLIITPSKWLKGVIENSFLSDKKVKVINNGIDLKAFSPKNSAIKEHLGIDGYKVLLGVANVWDERKGLKTINELSYLIDDNIKIVVAGVTKKQAKSLNDKIICFEKIHCIEVLAQLYSCADVFINPTMEENFPSANLEALACGTPVITFNSGGSGESIENGAGIITAEKTAQSMLEAINQLETEFKGEEFCREVAKKYDRATQFKKYLQIFVKE